VYGWTGSTVACILSLSIRSVSGQLHTLAALPLGKVPAEPLSLYLYFRKDKNLLCHLKPSSHYFSYALPLHLPSTTNPLNTFCKTIPLLPISLGGVGGEK